MKLTYKPILDDYSAVLFEDGDFSITIFKANHGYVSAPWSDFSFDGCYSFNATLYKTEQGLLIEAEFSQDTYNSGGSETGTGTDYAYFTSTDNGRYWCRNDGKNPNQYQFKELISKV